MLWDQRSRYVGTHPAQIEKILISRAIRLGFLRSLASAIQCAYGEANKINWRREEDPIGERAVKMLRDLLLRARSPALHVAPANAHAEVRAHMHNRLI